MRLRSCYQPPKKDLVFREVVRLLAVRRLPPIGYKDASKVCVDYLLQCLSTLDPDHGFFAADYFPDDAKTKSKARALPKRTGLD